MQLLHLLETAELLDTGQSVIAVIKIYWEHWSWLGQTASKEWRWHQTLRMGASCFTWTNLPLAPSVFLMSNIPTSPIQVLRETCILFLPNLLASSLYPLLILTLLVMGENWVAGIFFHQATYWSLHPQLSQKCMVGASKKAVLCHTMQGSHPWTALKFALMPSFQEDGAYWRH